MKTNLKFKFKMYVFIRNEMIGFNLNKMTTKNIDNGQRYAINWVGVEYGGKESSKSQEMLKNTSHNAT